MHYLMELRSFSHLHFIEAIKGDLVVKILNASRGRPALKFKKVQDVYETGDSENHDSVPIVTRPKLEFEDFPGDCTRAKDETTCVLASDRTIASEMPESNCNGGGSRGRGEPDDFIFMTLRQMKERCKMKKRKSRCKEAAETCSDGKLNPSHSQIEEQECDLMEPLSSWKSRISKNKKARRKFRKNCVPPSCQNALAIVKSEEFPSNEAILQPNGIFPSPIFIKIEVPDVSDPGCSTMTATDSSSSSSEFVSSGVAVSSEEPGTDEELFAENGLSIICHEEPETESDQLLQTRMSMMFLENPETATYYALSAGMPTLFGHEPPLCTISEECKEYLEYWNPKSLVDVRASVDLETANFCAYGPTFFSDEPTFCAVNNESHEYREHFNCKQVLDAKTLEEETTLMDQIPIKDSETATGCGLNTTVSTWFSNESQFCVVNKESNEYREHFDPKPILAVRDSDGEKMKEDVGEVIYHQLSDLCLSQLNIDPLPHANHSENISPCEAHSSATNSQSSTSMSEKLCRIGSDSKVQVPDITIDNSVQFMEHSYTNHMRLTEDGVMDDASHLKSNITSRPPRNSCSFANSNSYSDVPGSLVSDADASQTCKENQLSLSSSTCAEQRCSTVFQSCANISTAVEECHHSNLQHPPERLLSTRKVISPTSQKRLRQAMECSVLDDEQYYKYTRKLCYKKLTENKIGRLEGANQIKRSEATSNSNQFSQKTKNDQTGSHNKGIPKESHLPRAVPQFSTGCNSIQSCSESAILFSRQQMRDVESIAAKLSKELKSMKDIVEETLQSKAYPSTSLKYSAEEVNTAVQNATRVDENTRKWLSVMTRDCNRFCKIMKLTEEDSPASGKIVRKEKRKIFFADEAGRKLCDVRTFKHEEKTEAVD